MDHTEKDPLVLLSLRVSCFYQAFNKILLVSYMYNNFKETTGMGLVTEQNQKAQNGDLSRSLIAFVCRNRCLIRNPVASHGLPPSCLSHSSV